MEFPANSRKATEGTPEKRVERVTSADAIRRKKPLGKQFSETFIGGDARSAVHYVLLNVVVPQAKSLLAESGSQMIEKLIFGETRGGGGRRPRSSMPGLGHVQYNRMGGGGRPQVEERSISSRGRSLHDFDEIVLASRAEAEQVIDTLYDLVSKYDHATVADLYELTGLRGTHTDHKWGWTSLRGSSVSRLRNQGYLLDLPKPEPLG